MTDIDIWREAETSSIGKEPGDSHLNQQETAMIIQKETVKSGTKVRDLFKLVASAAITRLTASGHAWLTSERGI
jgi:hypothetical protein